jgi:hypothetical protein
MLELHPEVFGKDGKKHVIPPYEEFTAIEQALADAQDLTVLRTAKRKNETRTVSPSIKW